MGVVGSGLLARPMATYLGDMSKSGWFASCVTIVTLSTILPCSQAADYFGRKPIILISTVGGIVGSIIISRSNSIGMAIAGFCIIGVALGCQSVCYAIPSEVLPRKYRAHGQAATNVTSGLGATIGVLIGGTLTRTGSEPDQFRIFWYINCGAFVLGFLGVLLGYQPPLRELQVTLTTSEKLRRIDWIGNCLIAVGLTLFCLGLGWSGNPYEWSNGHVLGPFITGVIILGAFALYEWRGTSEGILHHGLFGDRNFPLSLIVIFVEGMVFFAVNVYLVFELSIVQQLNPFDGGLRFAVLFIASMVLAFAVGVYTTWTRQLREPLVLGFVLLVVFNVLMVFLKENTPAAASYGYAIIGGAGIGCLLTNAMVTAHMSTPPEMISVTSGLSAAVRVLGGSIGLAIYSAVFSSKLKTELPKNIAAAVLPLGFPPAQLGQLIGAMASGNQAAVAAIPGVNPQLLGAASHALTEAYKASFRNVWLVAAVISGIGVIGEYSTGAEAIIWYSNH